MIERIGQVIRSTHAPDVQPITATAGAAAGWISISSCIGVAQFVAAVATAAWMLAQTYVLIKNQRCTAAATCPNRKN